MALGDLITGDYQFQLHNSLYSAANNGVSIEYNKTVEGLGVPDAKTQDVLFTGKDGAYANPDYLSVRQINIPAILRKTTEAAAMASLRVLTVDWVPLAADTDLAFQLPGWNKFYVMGRPRGAKVDLTRERQGVIRVLLRFDCPNPAITYL